ncbi:MAG: cell division protein SepF [Actinomycetota bacterium]
MAGALRKTMVYLGLAEDNRYGEDEYDDYVDQDDEVEHSSGDATRTEVLRPSGAQVTRLPQRTLSRVPAVGGVHRINTIHPRTYNDAKTVGEAFRDGIPVIMNLSDMSDADAKRLVDFAAGLVFGLHGTIERVTAKVFLLSPAHVQVTADDRDADHLTGGPFNQS